MALHPFNGKRPSTGKAAFVAPSAELIGNVELGEGSTVLYNAVLRADAKIVIGKQSNVQDNCVLHAEKRGISIGARTSIGHGAIIEDSIVGDNSLVGMGAIVFDAEIGRNCIVAAGAVVLPGTRIPDNSLAVGAPARVLRRVSEENIKEIDYAWNYYAGFAEKIKSG